MIELTRGLSFVVYTYEGGPLRFNVPFPYLEREHVRAFVGEPDSARLVPVTWFDSHTIEIPSQEEHLTVPYTVTLRRTTPIDKPAVKYRNGANLPARDLNRSLMQLLYAQQEARDFANSGGGLPGGGDPGTHPDINTIIDQVMRSPALQILLERIELIDMNAESVLEDILRSHDYFDTKRNYGDKISTAEKHIELLERETEVIARETTDLFARIERGEEDIAARFLEVNQAIATEEEARAEAFRELQAQFTTADETLSSALNQRVDTVIANTEGAIAESEQRLGAQFGEDLAQTARTITAEVDATKSRVGELETSVAHHGENISGLIEETEVLSTAEKANTSHRLAMAAQYGDNVPEGIGNQIDGKITPVTAAFDQKIEAEASAREAVARNVETLQTTTAPTYFGDSPPAAPEGGFKPGSHWIKTGQSGAYLAHVWDGQRWLKSDLDVSSPTGALVQNLDQTKIDAEEAEAIASTQVQAFKDGEFAVVRQDFEAVAGEHAGMYGQWQASWSVRMNAGKINGVPVIAGVALSANPETGSDFVISADRFAFVHPQYTSGGTLANIKYPFVIGSVGGVSTVGIQGQLIVDGTITADKITTKELSAITANLGTVNGGTFKTHTLDSQGRVTNPNEFRVEVTNQGTYPFWIGSGSKNKNNAKLWVDRDGNAGFDGVVTAKNIRSQFQAIEAVSWYGAIIPDTKTVKEIVRFELPGPVLVGEYHRPLIALAVNIQSLHGISGITELQLHQLESNGTWTNVNRTQLNHGNGIGVNHALNVLAPRTDRARTYRLVAFSTAGDDRHQIQNVTGFVIGIR